MTENQTKENTPICEKCKKEIPQKSKPIKAYGYEVLCYSCYDWLDEDFGEGY